MKLAEVLSGPETWCKGAMTQGGRVCLIGALAIMLGRDPNDPHILDSTSPVLAETFRMWELIQASGARGDVFTLLNWNDEPARTWEEVAEQVEAYDRARMLAP